MIGREKEVEALRALLLRSEVRLVTLTGPGGVGKTSLAIDVVSGLSNRFEGGVFFVDLVPLIDAGLVIPTIAEKLAVREELGGPLFDRLSSMAEKSGVRLKPVRRPLSELLRKHIGAQQMLLLLDNFEHVLAAAAEIVDLLAACDNLKVLVTSRARLNVRGEHEFQVPTLSVPDPNRTASLQKLAEYAAVALFVRQAILARPNFRITPENSRAVAGICVRVDGLPLALELAAARVGVLAAQALLERLESKLELLTTGPRDLPARQKTLRDTIAWSYDLLDPLEKALFGRLGFFAGGCTIIAAEKICSGCGATGVELVNVMQSLIDKSLLRRVEADGEIRFVMLYTIREFALEALEKSGYATEAGRLHANFFAALVKEAEPQLRGPEQAAWLDRLERENDNLRQALQWLQEQASPEPCLETAGALWRYWWVRGYVTEGREWLSKALAKSSERSLSRAKALRAAAALASLQNEHVEASGLTEESLAIFAELGDKMGISVALHELGTIAHDQSNYASARSFYEQSLEIKRELGDKLGTAMLLNNLGIVAQQEGDYTAAKSLYEQSLAIKRDLGDKLGIAISLYYLARVACHATEYSDARSLFQQSLAIERDLEDKPGIADCLEGLAEVAYSVQQPKEAAKLLGAADIVRHTFRAPIYSMDRGHYESILAKTREMLDPEEFESAWANGRSMTLEEAVAHALQVNF